MLGEHVFQIIGSWKSSLDDYHVDIPPQIIIEVYDVGVPVIV